MEIMDKDALKNSIIKNEKRETKATVEIFGKEQSFVNLFFGNWQGLKLKRSVNGD